MNTAELKPTVPQAAIDAQFDQITAGFESSFNAGVNFGVNGIENFANKGFKPVAELGDVAVTNEVSLEIEGAADYMKSQADMASIARKAQAVYEIQAAQGIHEYQAAEQIARVGKGEEGDKDDEDLAA